MEPGEFWERCCNLKQRSQDGFIEIVTFEKRPEEMRHEDTLRRNDPGNCKPPNRSVPIVGEQQGNQIR